MNKKQSSKTKKTIEVKEDQKISTFFRKIQKGHPGFDDDDFQTTKVSKTQNVNKDDVEVKEKIKVNNETKQKGKVDEEIKQKTKVKSVVNKEVLKGKQKLKVIQQLDVSDDDFVTNQLGTTKNVVSKNVIKDSKKKMNKIKENETDEENETKNITNKKLENAIPSGSKQIEPTKKLITDTTLEKSYLKRDEIDLELTQHDPLHDITNIELSLGDDNCNSPPKNIDPSNRSPPHSTPICSDNKRKHCDIPDIIPETPEDNFMLRNRPSFEKHLLKTQVNDIEEQVVPDMIVKEPPFKIRKFCTEPKVVVNLSDLTKEEFEELQSQRFSKPVKEVVKVDVDLLNLGIGRADDEINKNQERLDEIHDVRHKRNANENNKKNVSLETGDENLKIENKALEIKNNETNKIQINHFDQYSKKITNTPRSSNHQEHLLSENNPKSSSPSEITSKLLSPSKTGPSPQESLKRLSSPKRSTPIKTNIQVSPSDLNLNDFINDSWDGISADVENLVNILSLDTWQYCKVIDIKTDMHHNKIIKVESISNGYVVNCVLQGVWHNLKLNVNNKINIIAHKTNDYIPYCVSNEHGFVIYEPDILISGTSVVGSLFCKRKGVLSDKFQGTEGSNDSMVIGSLVHHLFQDALKKNMSSRNQIKNLLTEILSRKDTVYMSYTSNMSMDAIYMQCVQFLEKIENFIKIYITNSSNQKNNWKGVIESIEDIEENFWCTSIGIKGKIDVTIKSKPNKSTVPKKPAESLVLPLELKTGRASMSLEHRGQVILYIMMMKELGYNVDSGLLVYLRDDLVVQEISVKHNEKRDLIILRNDLAYYLNQKPKIKRYDNEDVQSINSSDDVSSKLGTIGQLIFSELPEPIDHPTFCGKCPYSTVCSVFLQRENLQLPEKHPLNDVTNKVKTYLMESHINYFIHWTSLIQIESSYKPPLKELKDIWRLPPLEREVLGKSVCFLRLLKPVLNQFESFIHCFICDEKNNYTEGDSEKDLLQSGLLTGNYVIISTDKRVAVATGYVLKIKKNEISVSVERNLSKQYSNCVFHIDTYESQNIYTYNMLSMSTILENTDKAKRLRELIIEKVPPRFSMKLSKSVAVTGGKILKRLNKVQQRAVLKALTAQDYLLIKGMPGTGKTATIVALIQLLVELKKTVLITSHTNAAVDNVCLRLVDCGVDLLRLGVQHRIHPSLLPYSESYKTKNCKTTDDFRKVYNDVNVIAVTCLGVHQPVLSLRTLNVCIVDESTQVLQCSVLKALNVTDSFILIGDPDQLPPVVSNPEALQRGMNESLFERLDTSVSTITLTLQYRMNRTITSVANKLTYNGQLLCADDSIGYATLRLPKLERLQTIYGHEMWILNVLDPKIDKSVVGIDTGPTWKKFISNVYSNLLDDLKVPVKNTQEDEERSCSNIYEAGIIYTLIEALNNADVKMDTIGVIAPYRAQVALLKKNLKRLNNSKDVEVNTVDQYQGRDKDIILYSCSRTRETTKLGRNYAFEILEDKRRLTVAITRAKHKLIIIGDFCTLKQYSPFNRLINCFDTQQIVSLEDNPDGFNWDKVMNRIKNTI